MIKRLSSLLLLVACIACQAQSPLTGRWRSLATSLGGIGALFEFRADGTLDFSPGAVVESPYRIEGNEMISPSGMVNGPELHQTIEWAGDNTLHLKIASNPATELTRVGARKDAANLLLGEWTAKREMNGQSMITRWFFYPAGKSLFLLPFATLHGTYTVTGNSIRIVLPNRSPVEGPYSIDKDVLSIPTSSGKSERFARY